MKNITKILFITLSFSSVYSQEPDTTSNSKYKKTFFNNFELGQSMETIDKSEQPAQLMFTFPEDKPDSYLINIGLSYRFFQNGDYIHRLKSEYHKNSLTDKEQDNFEFGYQGFWDFFKTGKTDFFVTFDPKYVYDGIAVNNSFASNILFSWFNDGDNFHFNNNNFIKNKNEVNRFNFYPSVYFGSQVQHNFNSKIEATEGLIVRPMFTTSFRFSILGKEDKEVIRYSFSYSGREDLINNTDVEEGYTKLIKTGLDIYLLNKNETENKFFDVSIGLSYVKGSDPMKGLAEQNFWTLSLNVLK